MTELSPPLQQRSRETLNAISKAAKQLLKRYTFAELTIGQIIKGAGTSTGSFYARFKGKRALLHHLHEEFAQSSKAEIKVFVDLVGTKPLQVEAFAEVWIPEVVESHFEHRGILRATMIETFDDPKFAIRAAKLVRYISTKLADVIAIPPSTKDRDEHIHNIEQSMGAVMAILDQDLFYLRDGKPRRLSTKKIERLKRIFVASMAT